MSSIKEDDPEEGMNGGSLNEFGCGDSYLMKEVLPHDVSIASFDALKTEVTWGEMMHKGGPVPRLVAVQCDETTGEDNSLIQPVYRHPCDELVPQRPWSQTVFIIKSRIEELTGQSYNHCLIQYYRNGNDYISEHSDKTLDIKSGSLIVNVSLGATRTMILKEKKSQVTQTGDLQTISPPRMSQRFDLTHNSLFALGWKTNRVYLHSIRRDKRMESLKRDDEKAFQGERISLTFRNIATYRKVCSVTGLTSLYGQGATIKTFVPGFETAAAAAAAQVQVSEVECEADRLLLAFSKENSMGEDFSWDFFYGRGFDVLDMRGTN